MDKNNIKIFISYSHKDEDNVTEFENYFNPIKEKYSLEVWQDKENKAGDKFQKSIDDKLSESDIILLFVSANFLSSDACKKEMEKSLKLKNVVVIPIILSTCAWKDTPLKDLLATPKDGKPVDGFKDKNKAYEDMSNSIKKHIEELEEINQIEIKEEFKKFLQDTGILTKAYHNKQNVLLDDIFVSPQLEHYDETIEYNKDVDYQNLEKDITNYKNTVIAGDNHSGKTTLCKRLFLALKTKGYLPIYILDKDKKLQGNINDRIEEIFKEQYEFKIAYQNIINRVIPIIDNFHWAENKQKHIENLESYSFSILIIDDIYGLNVKNKDVIKNFHHFKIKEFLPSLRNELIQKYNQLTDKTGETDTNYKKLDQKTELVNTVLGKIIGNGIVPSYPFFIIIILSSHETANPLDENITSQGHCYQALIYIALRKEIDNKDIDIYLNFLNVVAYEFFETQKKEFSPDELNKFITSYEGKYNLPVKKDILLSRLNKAKLLVKDSLGNLSFHYDYLYFYFVAKYLADHIEENKKNIEKTINNLHKNENAYIAIFISHHSKNNDLLDEIVLNAMCLFDNYESITLSKEEIPFLEEEIMKHIIEPSLPESDETAEHNREKELKNQDRAEKLENKEPLDEEMDPLGIKIRRSIKTVEVMGKIIKNRSGSLEKERLKEIFENGMNVHMRLLKFFLELIKDKEYQDSIIDFIKSKLEKVIQKFKKEAPKEELRKIAKIIFWNLNLNILYGYINKTVYSLGADNLINISNDVCDKTNTPASFLVKHGILMWYSKNCQTNNICKEIQKKEFSVTAKKIMEFMIVSHFSQHSIDFKDRQKLGKIFKKQIT